jgi:hypothetical protein
MTTGQDVAVKLLRGKAFGSTDLAATCPAPTRSTLIANRFADWWNKRMQTALLSTLAGAMGSASHGCERQRHLRPDRRCCSTSTPTRSSTRPSCSATSRAV